MRLSRHEGVTRDDIFGKARAAQALVPDASRPGVRAEDTSRPKAAERLKSLSAAHQTNVSLKILIAVDHPAIVEIDAHR